jgi:hypothetical protein
METLSVQKMQSIEGGSWGCFFTIGALVTISIGAVLAPPAGAALAATIISSGVGFGGFVYGMASGACR